jgi:hypothetical protein
MVFFGFWEGSKTGQKANEKSTSGVGLCFFLTPWMKGFFTNDCNKEVLRKNKPVVKRM